MRTCCEDNLSNLHVHLNEARVLFNILNNKCTVVTFIVNGFSKCSTLGGCQMPRASAGIELFTKVIGQHKCQKRGNRVGRSFQQGRSDNVKFKNVLLCLKKMMN